jgi:BlaR1 peptidase M56/HEAT repeats/HEAT repeat
MMFLLRLTLLLLLTVAAYALARRRSAALRHAILISGLAATLLLPLIPAPRRAVALRVPEKIAASATTAISAVERRAPARRRPEGRRSMVPIIWGAGSAFFALRLIASHLAARRMRLTSPATIGVFRPVIVIPSGFPAEDRAAAFAHESAHVRRRDPLTRLVAQIACAVYWFHPLAWLAQRLALLEQERACDDAVLRAGFEPLGYAEVLLRAARGMAAGAMAMSSTRELERRLRSIVDERPRATVRPRAVVAVGAVALSIAATVAAVTIGAVLDPASERVLPEVREIATMTPAAAGDAALYAALLRTARKPKTWEGDLVAERSRWALSRARGGALLAPLREALDDPDWRVRAYAAWALAIVGDRASTPRLVALLDDGVWRMRAMAAHAIAASGDPRAREAMLRAAGDPAWQVRHAVAEYLGKLHDPAIQRLAADPHIAVRAAVEEASTR